MKYAKYLNKYEVEFPPKNKGDILNYDVFVEQLILDGYKELIEAEKDPEKLYNLTYEETETQIIETATEVPEPTPEELLRRAKAAKAEEALDKARDLEQNGTVEYKDCVFEMSYSNRLNLENTQEALEKMGQESTEWNDKNDTIVELTVEDIQYIRLNLILGRVQKLWIEDYPTYLELIEEAQTVEEVEAIEIDYGA